MIDQLPSSPRQLLQYIEQQKAAMMAMQEEILRLKAREVDVSSLTVRLQQQLSSTQHQVDHIKTQVHLQLANPVTETEYQRLEALPEAERDLLDVIKIGIFRQMGSLRSSTTAAIRRATELSSSVAQLTEENKEMKLRLEEWEARGDGARETREKASRKEAAHLSQIAELQASLAAAESKTKSLFIDQEQYLSSKLTAQMKTEEVTRLAVRLEESEMDLQRYRANAECVEQKLDILKSEYYEVKLKYGQRVLELEGALKASEEKLKVLGDLEMESELFIANLAESSGSGGAVGFASDDAAVAGETRGGAVASRGINAYDAWLALPRSRKLAHTLVVTKRCLHLENKVSSMEHELKFKETQLARLQIALDGAREALHNINSPYILVEKAMTELTEDNDNLKQRVRLLQEEKQQLTDAANRYSSNMKVLTHHRRELLRIKSLLKRLGIREGYVVDDVEERLPASTTSGVEHVGSSLTTRKKISISTPLEDDEPRRSPQTDASVSATPCSTAVSPFQSLKPIQISS